MNKYNIIYADPPWKYDDKGCRGAAEHHYNTLTVEELKKLPVNELAADNCILFIWGTYPMLREMFEVIEAWGFEYKSLGFQWVKLTSTKRKFAFGLGHYTRSNTEPCFIAVKGKPQILVNNMSQLVITPNLKHSKKPDTIRRKIVELCGDLPRIELFARDRADGWHAWGDEVDSDIVIDF